MFFIVPASSPETETEPASTVPQPAASRGGRQTTSVGDVEAYYRRRVAAACDRCRFKKARCSGSPAPCNKCKRDRVICIISKDKKLDTQPKPPEYVRTVESQRDLLLKAVHELRQKSNACEQTGAIWNAASDINRVLEELGVHNDHSEVVRESILEELHSPRLKPRDTSSKAASSVSNLTQSLEPPNFNHIQETNNPSTSSETSDFDRMVLPSDHQFDNDALFDAKSQSNDSVPFDENMLFSDWPPSSLRFFDFQEPADLDNLYMWNFQEPQTWQNGSTPRAHMPDVQ